MAIKKGKPSPLLNRYLLIAGVLVYLFIAFAVGIGAGQTEFFREKGDMVKEAISESRQQSAYPEEFPELLHTWTDDPAKAHDSLLLIAAHYQKNPAVLLVNRDGKQLHHWNLDTAYSNPEVIKWHQIENPAKGGINTVDDAVLFPNGDIIGIQDNRMLHNYRGQRLFRMDKDSKVLWQITGEFHHEIDLGGDGNIYAMDYELRDEYPVIDYSKDKNTKFLADNIMKVSPDGKVLSTISVPDAFLGTEYEFLLLSFRLELPVIQIFDFPDGTHGFDPLHTNSVQYLDKKLATGFPSAEEGDLLISLRGNSTIALLRPSTKKIVWATMGPWKHQHYVRLQPSGIIRIFDNEGAAVFADNEDGEPEFTPKSRILDYNPVTNKTSVRYFDPNNANGYTFWRGSHHEFSDGSLLYLSSHMSQLLQVSPEGKIIWELRGIPDREHIGAAYNQRITFARPYEKDYPAFLGKDSDK